MRLQLYAWLAVWSLIFPLFVWFCFANWRKRRRRQDDVTRPPSTAYLWQIFWKDRWTLVAGIGSIWTFVLAALIWAIALLPASS